MNPTRTKFRLLSVGVTMAITSFSPAACQAATAALPWDQTLLALQDLLISYVAPAAIGLALSAAIILYALGGRDERAGRLFGAALGGCIALTVVKLLNYVLP
jgi:hypothetical protein